MTTPDPLATLVASALSDVAKLSSSYDWDWYATDEVYAAIAARLRAAGVVYPAPALDVERLARALEAAISGRHVTPFALRAEFGLSSIWDSLATAISKAYYEEDAR